MGDIVKWPKDIKFIDPATTVTMKENITIKARKTTFLERLIYVLKGDYHKYEIISYKIEEI